MSESPIGVVVKGSDTHGVLDAIQREEQLGIPSVRMTRGGGVDTKVGWIPMLSFVRRQFRPLWFRLVVAACRRQRHRVGHGVAPGLRQQRVLWRRAGVKT